MQFYTLHNITIVNQNNVNVNQKALNPTLKLADHQ